MLCSACFTDVCGRKYKMPIAIDTETCYSVSFTHLSSVSSEGKDQVSPF